MQTLFASVQAGYNNSDSTCGDMATAFILSPPVFLGKILYGLHLLHLIAQPVPFLHDQNFRVCDTTF